MVSPLHIMRNFSAEWKEASADGYTLAMSWFFLWSTSTQNAIAQEMCTKHYCAIV